MKIDPVLLKKITNVIFEHIIANNQKEIDLDVDYYWHIVKEEMYDPYNSPQTFTMGQLSDDWDTLKKHLYLEEDPISYDLVYLASIFRAVGEKLIS